MGRSYVSIKINVYLTVERWQVSHAIEEEEGMMEDVVGDSKDEVSVARQD